MSNLNIRGKIIHCNSCEKSVIIEYEGGNKFTQIGDEGVRWLTWIFGNKQIVLNFRYTSNFDLNTKNYCVICKITI